MELFATRFKTYANAGVTYVVVVFQLLYL